MGEKYICIHGHFYQPPRENAWLESIEVQDSAHPYHDWNQRILAECYAANAYSRILDDAGRIERIVNNYEKISFNVGPTLLAWMEAHSPEVYQAILKADENSVQRCEGHGSALAQPYNHSILPLCNHRDKWTQIKWGIQDFEHRFGRRPEGMWLPETAVDLETLDILARLGIEFTILSPYQAGRVRDADDAPWRDVADGSIDPKEAYVQTLEDGRRIALFFYDGPISQAVAFEELLQNGRVFAERLAGGLAERKTPQLLHIATDGESYGHHSRFGDMALAYALHYIEAHDLATLTNYGAFLEKHPPRREVEIKPNTSWSCAHGVERWRSDCGCRSGAHPKWHQKWRRPLREAFDFLRDELAAVYEENIAAYFKDPWQARDDYIAVILDRSPASLNAFFNRYAGKARIPSDNVRILKLMEMQRHAMLMYTSCGWFFDDISGIETVQVIQYAGRALQLYENLFGGDLESRFLDKLSAAESNLPVHGDGRRIYETMVKPVMVDLRRVAAHYAIRSLFREEPRKSTIFCCAVTQLEVQRSEAGKACMAVGRLEITSDITQESEILQFAAMYTGDHQLSCGLAHELPENDFRNLVQTALETFERADFAGTLQLIDQAFGGPLYSLKSLFKDGQRRILNAILGDKIGDALSVYRHVYEPNVPLMRYLKNSDTPIPRPLYAAGEFVINSELRHEFKRREIDYQTVSGLLREAELAGIALDAGTLEYTLRRTLEREAEAFQKKPHRRELLQQLLKGVELVEMLPFDVNVRMLQNKCYKVAQHTYPDLSGKADQGDGFCIDWVDRFQNLCRRLNLKLPGGQ